MFEQAKTHGYTKDWEDKAIIIDKCNRCLETWSDIELGISTEADFEKERNGLYRVVVRIAEKDPIHNALINMHPKVLEVGRIKTKRDKALREEIKNIIAEVEPLTGKDEYRKDVMDKLDRAENIYHYLGRPHSLYDVYGEIGGSRRTWITKREFKI